MIRSNRPAPGPPASPPARLIDQLALIYATEAALASDLRVLFQRTSWLPFRLVLADLRTETNRHLDRLGCLIVTIDGQVTLPGVPVVTGRADRERAESVPIATIVADLLRRFRAAVTAYGVASSAATDQGLDEVASLLTRARVEEANTVRRLMVMVAELTSDRPERLVPFFAWRSPSVVVPTTQGRSTAGPVPLPLGGSAPAASRGLGLSSPDPGCAV